MGAEMVTYGDKLWIYAGAQPVTNDNPTETTFSDFFSFDLVPVCGRERLDMER